VDEKQQQIAGELCDDHNFVFSFANHAIFALQVKNEKG
jgi:hypothetical protein